ncbi:MAG: beta-propeller fold lactonase family protein [Deltaproteobacteria bacterium]|nr:beta-propeller fold lactonase family protein [Deltaproteobacteria bacterium]MBI3078548.1 beta-propeller fold lactonase family protein [Deltaproteobacteria bacterium]
MKPSRSLSVIRGASVALSLLALAGCTELMQKDQPVLTSRIYVANESSNSVTVIDGATHKVIGTVEARNVGTHDLSLSRDGRWLFATNLASGNLSVIDTARLETIASIHTGSRSHVVTLTNDNRHAWVANIAEDNVSIVDTESFRILGTIPVGKGPTGLTFSRDGRFAYVSNQGDKTVSVVETASHRVIKTIPVGTNPHFLVLGPDGRIWGTNTGGQDIYVIDPATQDKLASIPVGPAPQQIAFGFKGMQGPNAYVTVSGLNAVVVITADPRNPRKLEQIDVGDRPNGIWANPEGTRIYVGHEGSHDLRVIDTGTGEVIATVPVGRKPIRVVVSR